jgi:hypothetical protein
MIECITAARSVPVWEPAKSELLRLSSHEANLPLRLVVVERQPAVGFGPAFELLYQGSR